MAAHCLFATVCVASIAARLQGLEDMTRTRDGLQRVPLMQGVGAAVFVYDITRQEMAAAMERLLQYAASYEDAAALAALHKLQPASNNVVPFAVHSAVVSAQHQAVATPIGSAASA